MFISPVEFSNKTGLGYEFVRSLCNEGKIKCEKTRGNHIKIYKSELEKVVCENKDFISREDYEKVVRENEKLKTFISQLKSFIQNC